MPSTITYHLTITEEKKKIKNNWEVNQKHDLKELPPQNMPESPICPRNGG